MDVAGRSDFGGHDNVHHHNLYAWVQNCYQEDDQFYYDRFLNRLGLLEFDYNSWHLGANQEIPANVNFIQWPKLSLLLLNRWIVLVNQ